MRMLINRNLSFTESRNAKYYTIQNTDIMSFSKIVSYTDKHKLTMTIKSRAHWEWKNYYRTTHDKLNKSHNVKEEANTNKYILYDFIYINF